MVMQREKSKVKPKLNRLRNYAYDMEPLKPQSPSTVDAIDSAYPVRNVVGLPHPSLSSRK